MAEPLQYPFSVFPLSEEDGGGYLAIVFDLPGCMADGDTPEEAATAVASAVDEWVDEARRLNREIPQPGSSSQRMVEQQEATNKALAEIQQEVALLKETVSGDFHLKESINEALRSRLASVDSTREGQSVAAKSDPSGGRVYGGSFFSAPLPRPSSPPTSSRVTPSFRA